MDKAVKQEIIKKFARKEGDKGITICGALGFLMAIVFTVLLLIPIPGLNCSLSKESYICLFVWTALGLIFYITSKRKR